MSRRRGRLSARASTQLEFALILPFFLLFLVFSLNMGVLIVQHGALQHATNAAARAGAQVGGAGVNSTSQRTFETTLTDMPGITARDATLTIVSGRTCKTSGRDREVVVNASYRAPLVVPGMDGLIRMVGGDTAGSTWTLNARSLARCEVVRR